MPSNNLNILSEENIDISIFSKVTHIFVSALACYYSESLIIN